VGVLLLPLCGAATRRKGAKRRYCKSHSGIGQAGGQFRLDLMRSTMRPSTRRQPAVRCQRSWKPLGRDRIGGRAASHSTPAQDVERLRSTNSANRAAVPDGCAHAIASRSDRSTFHCRHRAIANHVLTRTYLHARIREAVMMHCSVPPTRQPRNGFLNKK
jgi:hypothetical protein